MNDLERAIELQRTNDALSNVQRRNREEIFDLLRRHYGLVEGETLLTHDGYVGVFREILNFYVDQKPWVSVSLTEKSKPNRTKRMHFYHGWEKVENS